jgi:outer membrane protein
LRHFDFIWAIRPAGARRIAASRLSFAARRLACAKFLKETGVLALSSSETLARSDVFRDIPRYVETLVFRESARLGSWGDVMVGWRTISRASQTRRIASGFAVGLGLLCALGAQSSLAETLASAMARAYYSNPDLNQQRAAVRAQDEGVALAKSGCVGGQPGNCATGGYRPTVTASGDVGFQDTRTTIGDNKVFDPAALSGNPTPLPYGYRKPITTRSATNPRAAGVTVTQNLFNGGRTLNSIRQADSRILGARETMRNTEQNVLGDAVTYYMNVLRDTAILSLQRNNVTVLQEQLRQTNDRFKVGEVTRTDVAQAEASLAQGQAAEVQAESNLKTSIANYTQVIGIAPKRLEPAHPPEKWLPKSLNEALDISQAEHPAIQAALHGVDASALQVNIAEAGLYPTANLVGTATVGNESINTPRSRQTIFSVFGNVTVPLYDGGVASASTRQAKELLGQSRLSADLQRDKVRSAVVSFWAQYTNSSAVIRSVQAQVTANEVALNGVREEAKVGQRTTLDVLNAQQALLSSRVNLVSAQRDRVVAGSAVLSAVGRLTADALNLPVERYDPQIHYEQVKDKWFGLRTPDGR